MYFYQTVHQKLTKPYNMSPIGPAVRTFAYREPLASHRTPNHYIVRTAIKYFSRLHAKFDEVICLFNGQPKVMQRKSGNVVLSNIHFCTKEKMVEHGNTSGRFLI